MQNQQQSTTHPPLTAEQIKAAKKLQAVKEKAVKDGKIITK